MMSFPYAVHLEVAEEGGFIVTCRDLPELVTQGDDLADALIQAADAMDEVFALYIGDGRALPIPTAAQLFEEMISPALRASV